jgi:hypothetical protein
MQSRERYPGKKNDEFEEAGSRGKADHGSTSLE